MTGELADPAEPSPPPGSAGSQEPGVPTWSRRHFLAAAGVAAVVGACGSGGTSGPDRITSGARGGDSEGWFSLGVASGDPDESSVILWTRLAPEPTDGGGMGDAPVTVAWEVARDEAFSDIVAQGTEEATAGLAHSVHAEASGLEPDSWYWYRFRAGGRTSPVGRTRTTPAAASTGEGLRFAFASCQSWVSGFYPAWGFAADEDLDLVVFLGDYIYEGGRGGDERSRSHNSDAVTDLDGYRNRYGLYKGDANLQAAHAAAPWVTIWDDHEVVNNFAGARGDERVDRARQRAAYQAYYEHQPLRMPPAEDGSLRIYRTLDWGSLARFYLLDGRQHRSGQPCGDEGSSDGLVEDCAQRRDPDRTMLGDRQEDWLAERFGDTAATWNVLANQTILSPVPVDGLYNGDQWDGYPAARSRLIEALSANEVANPVIITGDLHASAVTDFGDEGSAAAVVGTELVGTSISSRVTDDLAEKDSETTENPPRVRWFEPDFRGYTVCEVAPDRLEATYRVVSTALEPEAEIAAAARWEIRAGIPGARRLDG